MLAFVDLETCGLETTYCQILEVAAIVTDENKEIVGTFHKYINPGRAIPEEIVRLTKITDEKVANCQPEWEVLQEFIDWINGFGIKEIVAYNGSFDMRFLRNRSDRRNLKHPFWDIELIDPIVTLRKMVKNGEININRKTATGRVSYKQEAVAEALGIEYGTGGAHSAIEDVIVLKKIYDTIMR